MKLSINISETKNLLPNFFFRNSYLFESQNLQLSVVDAIRGHPYTSLAMAETLTPPTFGTKF